MENKFGGKSERIARLSQQIKSINREAGPSISDRMDQDEYKINVLEEKIKSLQEEDNKKYNSIREHINAASKIVDEQKQNRELMGETKLKELEGIDERLALDLQSAINLKSRLEAERRIKTYIDEKFNSLAASIKTEAYERDRTIDKLSTVLDEDITRITTDLNLVRVEREEQDEIVVNSVSEEISKLAELVNQESEKRESSEQAVYELLKDVVNKVKVEIENEKQERERSEDVMLGLLEETCSKIQNLSAG